MPPATKPAVNLPQRKPNRLPLGLYVGKQFYFVTICVQGHRKAFTNADFVDRLSQLLHTKCSAHGFMLYAYCFMPDHVHLELVGMNNQANLQAVIWSFKGAATAIGRSFGVSQLWQKGFYDHVLRSGEHADSVAGYIFNNPVRAGLINNWTAWPFSGSSVFQWRKLQVNPEPFVPPWKAPAP